MGLHYSERIVMASTNPTLLRLHVEAVWGVRLPFFVLDDVELLPDGPQPSWKLCAAALPEGRAYLWRPDVTTMEREVLRLRVGEALAFSSIVAPPDLHREVALSLGASPRLDKPTARNIARPLTQKPPPLVHPSHPHTHTPHFTP